jgi:hypothetical protein
VEQLQLDIAQLGPDTELQLDMPQLDIAGSTWPVVGFTISGLGATPALAPEYGVELAAAFAAFSSVTPLRFGTVRPVAISVDLTWSGVQSGCTW